MLQESIRERIFDIRSKVYVFTHHTFSLGISSYLITFTSPPTPSLMILEAGGFSDSLRREVHT